MQAGSLTAPVYDVVGAGAARYSTRSGGIGCKGQHAKGKGRMQNFRYSEAGLALTKRFEGLRLVAYQDSGGVWTVGYGHTGKDVGPGRQVTAFEAEALLRADLRTAIDAVNQAVQAPLEQNQFDAIVDFTFNAGRGNFRRSSLLAKVNARDFDGAAGQFELWINVNGRPVPGLVRRRAAEAALFKGCYRANSIA